MKRGSIRVHEILGLHIESLHGDDLEIVPEHIHVCIGHFAGQIAHIGVVECGRIKLNGAADASYWKRFVKGLVRRVFVAFWFLVVSCL